MKLNDCLVSFIQPAGQGDHDISLFQQQLLVSVHLLLVLFDLDPFLLYLLHLLVEFHSHYSLLLLQSISELRQVLYLLTTNEDLRVHGLYFLFENLLLLLLLHELPRSHFQSGDSSILVFFGSPFFILKPLNLIVRWEILS